MHTRQNPIIMKKKNSVWSFVKRKIRKPTCLEESALAPSGMQVYMCNFLNWLNGGSKNKNKNHLDMLREAFGIQLHSPQSLRLNRRSRDLALKKMLPVCQSEGLMDLLFNLCSQSTLNDPAKVPERPLLGAICQSLLWLEFMTVKSSI